MLVMTCVRATMRIFSSFSTLIVLKRSSRLKNRTVTSVAARTVAVRGMSYMTAISPKKAPFGSWPTMTSRWFVVLRASQDPRSMMYSLSPISPSLKMFWPRVKVNGHKFPARHRPSSAVRISCERSGTLERNCPRSSTRRSAMASRIWSVLVLRRPLQLKCLETSASTRVWKRPAAPNESMPGVPVAARRESAGKGVGARLDAFVLPLPGLEGGFEGGFTSGGDLAVCNAGRLTSSPFDATPAERRPLPSLAFASSSSSRLASDAAGGSKPCL
mmetsp:Transcript_52881/g.113346  ORF Transcript_52881/g.113346 Transcript_52881/m.113346 type:complete len:273 (+) Transcript_52881:1934-2752(+)